MTGIDSTAGAPSIALVDDDAAHRMLVRRALRSVLPQLPVIELDGFRAAKSALLGPSASVPSLLIVDLNLGDGYGAELVAEIGRSTLFVRTQLLVVSTSFLDEDVGASYRAGAHGFLLKSSDPREFAAQIGAAAVCLLGLAPFAGS